MKYLATALAIAGIFSLLVLAACGGNGPAVTSERGDGSGAGESGGEHSEGSESEGSESGESNKESGEHSNESELGEHGDGGELEGESEAGEESGTQYGVNETYDEVRAGARLIISYDANNNTFNGSVENTTSSTLTQVRVEVHLSNGIELGPTTPVDLAPGAVIDITLEASSQPFETWSAHPEAG